MNLPGTLASFFFFFCFLKNNFLTPENTERHIALKLLLLLLPACAGVNPLLTSCGAKR